MYDTLSDFALHGKRQTGKYYWLHQLYEKPDEDKWNRKDCPQCHGVFCVDRIDNGRSLRCFNCGHWVKRPRNNPSRGA